MNEWGAVVFLAPYSRLARNVACHWNGACKSSAAVVKWLVSDHEVFCLAKVQFILSFYTNKSKVDFAAKSHLAGLLLAIRKWRAALSCTIRWR